MISNKVFSHFPLTEKGTENIIMTHTQTAVEGYTFISNSPAVCYSIVFACRELRSGYLAVFLAIYHFLASIMKIVVWGFFNI